MDHNDLIKNQLFCDSLMKLADKAIEKYQIIDKSNLPVRPIIKIKKFERQTKYENETRLGYELIVKQMDIFNLQEFKNCIDIVENDEVLSSIFGKMIKIGNSGSIFFSEMTLSLLCSKALEDYDNKIDYKSNLLKSYLDLERLLHSDHLPIVLTIPVHNLKLDDDLQIDPQINLKRVTTEQKEQFFNTHFLPQSIPHELFNFDALLELRYEVDKKLFTDDLIMPDDDAESIEVKKKLKHITYSLQILKEGPFEFLGFFRNIDLNIPERAVGFNSMVSGIRQSGILCELNSTELINLQKIYHYVSLLIRHEILLNALEWFDSYTKERNSNKKVIFITIVVETLFTNPGEHDLLTHKISSRIARFNEIDFNLREEIYDNLKIFYDFRSLILHGEDVEQKKLKVRKLRKYFEQDGFTKSINYIRKAIRKYIEAAMEFNQESDMFLKYHKIFIKKLDLE